MAAYAVSKAALVHLTRVLDLELRPLGIRLNAVAPVKGPPCHSPQPRTARLARRWTGRGTPN